MDVSKSVTLGPLVFCITYYAQKRITKIMWHILRHLTHSSGDMATICYIYWGTTIDHPHGNIKKIRNAIPELGLVYRIRGEWGSGVTMLLRYNTGQYIVTTTTIRHPKSAGVSSIAV